MTRAEQDEWRKLEELFAAALECPVDERPAFVTSACEGDDSLRRRLEGMLAADLDDAKHLEESPVRRLPRRNTDPPIPERIDRYRIVSVIASGGMATVYEAEQDEPRRTVALKVIHEGIASPQALRRFHNESELLARLRHPGIAEVYDAGIDDRSGKCVPYFTMEYVPNGKPITHYAAERNLDRRERLALFSQVCDAVDHGHQHGVIHRDLKPSNVLVDAEGRPHVIDFGVARSTDSDIAIATMQTETGQLLGTLQYMSPEQCSGQVKDVDARSDVYSLGVLLYELLGRRLPYDVSGQPVYEAVRTVNDSHPIRLGTLDSTLRGDIETIVDKALSKERERRYASAGELAADIRRHLSGDAVTARPASVLYRIRVFTRRNKALVVTTAIVFTVLVVSLLGVSAAMLVARSEKAVAQAALSETQQVADALSDAISRVDPEIALGRDVTIMRQLLDDVAARIGTDIQFAEDSLAEAKLRTTIGRTYRSLGLHDQAEPHLKKALTIRRRVLGLHPDVVTSIWELSLLHHRRGGLGDREKADELRRQILDLHHDGKIPDSVEVALSMAGRGLTLVRQGEHRQALSLTERALVMIRELHGEQSREIAWVLNNLGIVHNYMDNLDESERYHRETLAMRLKVLGPDHPHLAYSYYNLARIGADKNDVDKEGEWMRTLLDFVRRVVDPEHPIYIHAHWSYGDYLFRTGQLRHAESMFRVAMKFPDKLGLKSQFMLRRRFGVLLGVLGKFEEGEKELLAAYEDLRQDGDSEEWISRFRRYCCNELIDIYKAWGKPDEVERWRAELAAISARDQTPANLSAIND